MFITGLTPLHQPIHGPDGALLSCFHRQPGVGCRAFYIRGSLRIWSNILLGVSKSLNVPVAARRGFYPLHHHPLVIDGPNQSLRMYSQDQARIRDPFFCYVTRRRAVTA